MRTQKSLASTLERIVNFAQKAMQPNEYSKSIFGNDKPSLYNWIEKYNEKAKSKWFYKLFPILESKTQIEYKTKARKTAELCKETYDFVYEIAKMKEIYNIDKDNLKKRLLLIEKKFLDTKESLDHLFCNVPGVIEDSLFEYDEIVEERLTHSLRFLLDNKPEKIKYIGGDPIYKLGKYGNRFPELTKKIIFRIGEIYLKDIEMQRKDGKRKMAAYSLMPVIPISTASNCINTLNSLSYDLGIEKQEIYRFAGLNFVDIERDQKEWKSLIKKKIKEYIGDDPFKLLFVE